MTKLDFRSDNSSGIAPRILVSLAAANGGNAASYGADNWTLKLEQRFRDLFEHEVTVFLLSTGTAANALALSQIVPPWGVIYCHSQAHIEVDECGAPGFFTGGAKLVLLDGTDGKITAQTLTQTLDTAGIGIQHRMQPAAVSLTQASECGTVYTIAELQDIAAVAHAKDLAVHMDGARLVNALAYLKCTPADITWRAGIDVLSFGATKNGALAAEAVIFFDPVLAHDFAYRRKQTGHLLSKMRFCAAQWLGYLDGDQWLVDAAHANTMAQHLKAGLLSLPGVRLIHPVDANEVFVHLPKALADHLTKAGVLFYVWEAAGKDAYRFVTSWDTSVGTVEQCLNIAKAYNQVSLST